MVRRFNRNYNLAKKPAKKWQQEKKVATKKAKNSADKFLVQKAKQFIKNLSEYRLTDKGILALGKGLNSIPIPDKPSKKVLMESSRMEAQ